MSTPVLSRPALDRLPAVPPTRPAPPPAAIPGRPRRPAPSPLRATDLWVVLALNAGVIGTMWWRHGGLAGLTDGASRLIALGQLTALYGTFAVLVQLVLIARVPWLERRFGMDQLNAWHRWNGFAAVMLLTAHATFTTLGLAARSGLDPLSQVLDFVRHWPNVLAAIVALGLLVAVAVTSVRSARRALTYETWWFVHLYAYLAVVLGFAHQLAVGADFVADRWARAYWVALHAAVALAVAGYRFAQPIARGLRHRLRVVEVVPEGPGVVSIVLGGRRLDRLAAEAGQFFLLRFLRRDRWWKAHPFSLSAAPDGRTLRFTVKALGDDTRRLQSVAAGTRVLAEGPYGAFTAARASRRRVALIGGGIGIAPIRALYESIDRPAGDVTLLYRARNRPEAVLYDELADLSQQRGFPFLVSYSRPAGTPTGVDPFHPDALRAAIPDLAERDVFVCGPPRLIAAATAGLRAAGVPRAQVHAERFAY